MKSVTFSLTRLNTVGLAVALVALPLGLARAQSSPYLYHITFKGMCYQTNAAGNMVATPLTEQTILDAAAQAGTLDPSSVALVYHIQGSGLGDTIDVVKVSDGSTIVNLFGLYFGDDPTLGRTAATNAAMTEVRRLDYIYTQQNFTYGSFNSHSMGAAFTTKRFITADSPNGPITNTVVNAQVSWIVNPLGTSGTKVCTGNLATTTPFP